MNAAGSRRLPSVFIGSSTEGLAIARHLQSDLEATQSCSVVRWDQGIFKPSTYLIPRLADAASKADFAVLIATADDIVQSRGIDRPAARDNVYFELGLFIGALGLDRTYVMLVSRDLQLPSDLQGLTWLPYRERDDENVRAGVNDATLQVVSRVQELGQRPGASSVASPGVPKGRRQAMAAEIAQICSDAQAQGWTVKSNSATVLRLRSPKGKTDSFAIGEASRSREELRSFAAKLRANGLRVSQSVRRPVSESPIPL